MPTYDYQCAGCGQTFEVFQRMSDEPISSCPDCAAPARRRISGGSGFIFKGEGFYITDHRSQEYRDRAAADAGKEPATASTEKTSGGDSAEAPKKNEAGPAAASSSDSGTISSSSDSSGPSPSGSGAGSRTRTGSEP